MNKAEITAITIRATFVAAFAALILYFTTPGMAGSEPAPAEKNIADNRLELYVAADTLVSIIESINKDRPNVFELERKRTKLLFFVVDEKPFNTIFLDGEYLTAFHDSSKNGIEKMENQKGFSLAVVTIKGRQYVRIPSEIMHSIQLQKR